MENLVFYSGYGRFDHQTKETICKVAGFFGLPDFNWLQVKHTGKTSANHLLVTQTEELSVDYVNQEYSQLCLAGFDVGNYARLILLKDFFGDDGQSFCECATTFTKENIFKPASCQLAPINQTDSNLDLKNLVDLNHEHISDDLKTLFKAAFEFWSSADPENKSTHPVQDDVAKWLKQQGYSDASANQGATIIRPKWGAIGRRPTK